MNEELVAKCGCAHCGNHIEFPIEAAGQYVHCPHCEEATQLNLMAPPPSIIRPGIALRVLWRNLMSPPREAAASAQMVSKLDY